MMKKKKGMAAGGLKMVKGKDGKMVPFYAADGKGKMYGGGMTKRKKGMAAGGVATKGKAKGGARGGRNFSHLIQSKRGK